MLIKIIISGLVIGFIYGLVSLGYSMIYRSSGLMNFAQGDFMTMGAFLGYTFYKIYNMPFIVSFLLVVLIGTLMGILIEKGVIRVLLNNHVPGIYIVLATIAISYILQNGAMIAWGTSTLNFPQIFSVSTISILGATVQTEAGFTILVSLVIMLFLHIFMKYTKYGTAMRAAAMDATAARACGINPSLTTSMAWGISAVIASIGGMLIGPIYGVYTSLGSGIGRKGFAGAVMGGFGNIYGALIGGVLLGLIETFTSAYISSSYKDLIAYGLLLIFLFVKPTGITNEEAITE